MNNLSSSISTIVMFVVLIALMYFMMIKPQKKQQQQHQKMLSELKPGDEITTIGGLHAVVSEIDTEKALKQKKQLNQNPSNSWLLKDLVLSEGEVFLSCFLWIVPLVNDTVKCFFTIILTVKNFCSVFLDNAYFLTL